jgi:serine O-acetyltransferase
MSDLSVPPKTPSAGATEAVAPGGATAMLGAAIGGLRAARQAWRESQRRPREVHGRDLPSREVLARIVEGLRGALFPMRLGPETLTPDAEDYYVGHVLAEVLGALRQQVMLELRHLQRSPGAGIGTGGGSGNGTGAEAGMGPGNGSADVSGAGPGDGPRGVADAVGRTAAQPAAAGPADPGARAEAVVDAFAAALPGVRRLLDSDVLAAYRGDPAARSVDEVLLCYPGVRAMINHRIAHELYRLGVPLLARVIAEIAHGETGIDIHPGARIGPGFFIDHGTGVVIGETAVIGERVRLYQNVTLGAKSFPAGADGSLVKGLPRHPVVEDEVVIYAGATVLGRVTIGRGSVIGGNVWLTHSVPPGSQLTQADSLSRPCDETAG